jgi:hypothetical protein
MKVLLLFQCEVPPAPAPAALLREAPLRLATRVNVRAET